MKVITTWARCPGTCGEWVQGSQQGMPFLVDCPVDRFAEVVVRVIDSGSLLKVPPRKAKVGEALRHLAETRHWQLDLSADFKVELPEGKGMASSTADIVAAAAAASLAAEGRMLEPKDLAKLALRIEPTDSVMFPGLTQINHTGGRYCLSLGEAVPAQFLALDWGGQVDTLSFNARHDLAGHYRKYEKETSKALELAKAGIKQGDLEKLASAATLSAFCNQEINPKIHFSSFLAWVKAHGGLGVIAAHSGTLLAGVFPPGKVGGSLLGQACEEFAPVFSAVLNARGGGVESGFGEG